MNKKLWHNNLRGLFLIGLFFCSQFLYSQDPQTINNSDAFAPSKATVTTPEVTPSPEPTNGMIESEIYDEMDNSAEEIMKQQKLLKEKVEKLQNPDAGLRKQADKLDADVLIKDFVHASNPELSREEISKMKLSDAIKLAIAPLRKMSSVEMRNMVLDHTRGQKYYFILVDYPKILDFIIELIRDENAIPHMVKVIENKDRFKIFVAVMLCSIIFGFVIARIVSTKEKNLKKIFALFVLRIIIMFSIRIGIVYYFFSEELTPAFNVLIKVISS